MKDVKMRAVYRFFILLVLVLLVAGCGTNSFNPPAEVVATAKSGRIELKWKSLPSVSGYNVYRAAVSGSVGTKSKIATVLTATTYQDSAVTPGVTYFYQVTGFNSTGDSSASPEVSAAIKAASAGDVLLGGGFQGTELSLSSQVATSAGSAVVGAVDGVGTATSFNYPIGITTDGKNLFLADTFNNSVRKMAIATREVTTVAGSLASGTGDGIGTAARFYHPYGITNDGGNLYVSDLGNHEIRRIDSVSGEVTTLAGSATSGSSNGTGANASFKSPRGITTDGTHLYVADSGNHTIRKIVIATRAVTTLAGSGLVGSGDGIGTAASFNTPDGITTDGVNLFVSDSANHTIRKIVIATGEVTTMAGSTTSGSMNGIGTAASFNAPAGLATDGTNLYIADSKNNLIRKIVISSGAVTTLAGSGSPGRLDGNGTGASFSQPMGITSDGVSLFVADYAFCLLREIY